MTMTARRVCVHTSIEKGLEVLSRGAFMYCYRVASGRRTRKVTEGKSTVVSTWRQWLHLAAIFHNAALALLSIRQCNGVALRIQLLFKFTITADIYDCCKDKCL